MRVYDEGSGISPPTDGLVGYWSMDDFNVTASNVTDLSGNGNDGVKVGNPVQTNGQIGEALSFDGVVDEMNAPFSSSFSNGCTISLWVKTLATGQDGWVINLWKHASKAFGIKQVPSDEFKIYEDFSDTDLQTTPVSIELDSWVHLVAVYDNFASEHRMYKGGSLVGSAQANPLDGVPADTVSIGNRGPNQSNYTTIEVDDVRVYDRTLSESEIQRLYQYDAEWNLTPIKQYDEQSQSYRGMNEYRWNDTAGQWEDAYLSEGLVGYWSLDDFTIAGTTVSDLSGNGNDGTINGSPTQAEGPIGDSLDFDGTTDTINVAGSASLELDYVSAFAWIKCTVDSWQVILDTEIYSFQIRSPGDFRADVTVNGTQYTTGAGPILNDGNWYHVGFTYDGDTLTPYTNAQIYDPDSTMDGPLDSGISDIQIAENADNSPLYDGLIDEVRIYDRALTASEVSALYEQGNPQ